MHQDDTDANPTCDLNAQVFRQQPIGLANKVVLEIGCGIGLNTIWLAERAQCVVAIDIAEGMLREARGRLGQRHVCFLQANLTQAWPLQRMLEVIIANLILEHMQDLVHVFAEAHHVPRVGGLCI